jgi:hypothetical protein
MTPLILQNLRLRPQHSAKADSNPRHGHRNSFLSIEAKSLKLYPFPAGVSRANTQIRAKRQLAKSETFPIGKSPYSV